jgi:prepilin-type N-terminal cleavage/methylation domain-containing protein
MRRSTKKCRGFTLLELVVIIAMIGILAVAVLPRMQTNDFAQHAFHSGVKTLLQHARRTAIASRRYECISVSGDTVLSLTRDPGLPEGKASINCSANVDLPVKDANCAAANQVCAPPGLTVTGSSSLIFDPQGRLVTAPGVVAIAAATLNIDGEAAITVAPETGYVQ